MKHTTTPRHREGPAPGDRLLSPREAAERLGMSRRTIFALLARDELRRVRIGRATRIVERDLEDLIRRSTEAANG